MCKYDDAATGALGEKQIAGGYKMISITIATIPFIIACAIFLMFFFAISVENAGTMLLPIVAIGVSIVIYFAIYGFAKVIHLF